MKTPKLHSLIDLQKQIPLWKESGKKIVFTNGCFDVFHAGHAYILNEAKKLGDVLIVGLNSDASVTNLKGQFRPINKENERAYVLASLEAVDGILYFEEDTPLTLIKIIQPDVLVKGGDYTLNDIVGANEVIANGGSVKVIPLIEGLSSTSIIEGTKK